MEESYIPKAPEQDFCEGLNLCSVRRNENGRSMIGIKDSQSNTREEILGLIINSDTYNGKEIVRVYSSGHIFFDEDKKQVFLVTTEKNGITQHQFTGGSPIEQENKEVIIKENGVYKFDLGSVKQNARIRTQNRTGVKITKEYNNKPIVDWILREENENGKTYYKLVCLMHYIVKTYEGILGHTGEESIINGKWYRIENIKGGDFAPNAYIVSKKALELLKRIEKTVIISDFSKTLTGANNPTSWSVFAKSGFLGKNYTKERDEFYKKYHQFETNGNIEKTIEWWLEHMILFKKYLLNKGLVKRVTNNKKYFEARLGLKTFMEKLKKQDIKLLIISSGISNFIESFLEQNGIDNENIEIKGNNLTFDENGVIIGYDKNNIITPLNKNNHRFDLDMYKKIILLGDDKSDLSMYKGNCLKIGFCEESDVVGYDIYLGKNGDLRDTLEHI